MSNRLRKEAADHRIEKADALEEDAEAILNREDLIQGLASPLLGKGTDAGWALFGASVAAWMAVAPIASWFGPAVILNTFNLLLAGGFGAVGGVLANNAAGMYMEHRKKIAKGDAGELMIESRNHRKEAQQLLMSGDEISDEEIVDVIDAEFEIIG